MPDTVDSQQSPDPQPPGRPQRQPWVPLILVVLYWSAHLGFGLLELPMFTRFLARAAALLLVLLLFAIWWLWRGETRLRYRFLVLGWAVLCAVFYTFLMHRSVLSPSVHLLALPALLTLWAAWLVMARTAVESTRVIGLLILPVLVWAPGTLVRMEGLKGDGGADFHWRWAQTAEERFLERQPAGSHESPATDSEPLVIGRGDWPGFRGPECDARVGGVRIATDWQAHPPQQVWRTPVGPGWSSLALVGNRLFTQEQRGQAEVVSCFNCADGLPVWVHEDQGRYEEPLGGVGPRATPTFANGMIFALGGAGRLNCLDAVTGKRKWTTDIVADASSKLPSWGFSGSPLVVDSRVIVFAGGEKEKALLAYDVSSGKIAWKASAGVESYVSPQRVSLAGGPQLLFVADHELNAFDPETGKLLWRYDPALSFGRPVVQPRLIGESQLLVSFVPDSGVTLLDISRQGETWNVAEKWRSQGIKPDFSDFVHVADHLYGFDGNIFCCLDLKTGKRKWKGGRYGAGQVLLLADQPLLLVITELGELVLVRPDTARLEELARFQALTGKTWNHPVLSGNRLYVRNAEEMACFALSLHP